MASAADTHNKPVGPGPAPSDELRISQALTDKRWAFRTVAGIAQELMLPVRRVQDILERRPDLARRSVMTARDGSELYTAPERPLTLRERLEQIRWLLAR